MTRRWGVTRAAVKRVVPGLNGPTVIDIMNGGAFVAVHAVVAVDARQLVRIGPVLAAFEHFGVIGGTRSCAALLQSRRGGLVPAAYLSHRTGLQMLSGSIVLAVAAVLYGAHQIFTRLAADRIGQAYTGWAQ